MSKIKPSQAVGMWALTVVALFFIASLFSWSIEKWNWFSKLIFWAPSIILGIWTIKDYFIDKND
jgi:hypothetical protein